VKSARAVGIPTVVCVASWDNLSSKQLLREIPDAVVVWNEIQRREAEEIHSVPSDRIVVTGAQSFDLWFDWQPRPRAEFAARVGLDPKRRYILFLGGSLFPAALTEAEYVRDHWLPAVRSRRGLDDLQVLVRPHPSRMPEWERAHLEQIDDVAVWPLGGNEMPVDSDARADFYDSIHHSDVVVGLNTSAMIETAIIDRPVLTIIVPEFHESQFGTFHFDYLLTVAGGLPRLANSLDEHLDQLEDTAANGDPAASERNRRFVAEFVRPHGLDRPATPNVVDAIERVAASGRRGRGHRVDPKLVPLRVALEAYIYSKRAWWKLTSMLGRRPAADVRR
jgi:hypothetical protein